MDGVKSLAQKKRRERAMTKAAKQFLKDYRKHPEYLSGLFLEKFGKHVNGNLGIFSLSEREDSILMWAHYASNHKGFVLGFNSEHSFFQRQRDDHRDIGTIQQVHYSEERLEVAIADISTESRMFLRKNSEWGYEKELRLIRRLDKAAEVIRAVDPFIYLFDIPKDAIASITFGMNTSDKDQSSVLQKIGSDPLLAHIRCQNAVMDRTSFKINTVLR